MRGRRGYILVETLVALSVLSICMIGINAALRQAVFARALAKDLTQARFLAEQIAGAVELQPVTPIEKKSGAFDPPYDGFSWAYEVSTVEVPAPPIPTEAPPGQEQDLELPVPFVGKLNVVVSWRRQGQERTIALDTLFDPDKLPEQQLEELRNARRTRAAQ